MHSLMLQVILYECMEPLDDACYVILDTTFTIIIIFFKMDVCFICCKG